ncbi:MAG: P27 family phage terminase small subunit [Pseudomonadota bacterium]
MARGGSRPGSGRKPTSSAIKKLRGTEQAEPKTIQTIAADEAPLICPMHLSDLAQLLFAKIAGILAAENRASGKYAEHIALLAMRLEQIQRFQSVLEMEGDTYEAKTANGFIIRARPEVAMLSDAMRQAQSLLGELMLNPASALKLASGHQPEAGDFDDF